jgi:hypothetical protein
LLLFRALTMLQRSDNSDFGYQAEGDRAHVVISIRKGFDELSGLMTRLHRCLIKRERTRRKLETAARALVRASETSDLAVTRHLLAEALDSARDGLADIDGAEPPATKARELETTAD